MNWITWYFTLNPHLSLEQRRRSNMLRVFSLFLLGFLPLFLLINYILVLSDDVLIAPAVSAIVVILLICQLINRLSYVRTSASILVLSMIVIVLYYITTQPANMGYIYGSGPLLIVPIVVSSATIGGIVPLLVAILCSVTLTVEAVIITQGTGSVTQYITVPVFIFAIIGVFSWLSERYISQLLQKYVAQNLELEARNKELAAKRNVELQISDRINVLAAQVSSASAEQSRGANDQLSGIVEATTTLEQLNQTNKQIARAAQQVASSAQEALQVAEHGGDTVRTSVEAMSLLQERVGNIAGSMDDLFRQAQEIDQIIELITVIADETDLLALNATIEAAGAREYGRRFAAVANEVQRLAGRTSEAAESVRMVIGEVQEAIKKATEVTKQGLRDATSLSVSSSEVRQTIEGMVQMVQNTAILAQQISFSIQQQESAGTQIVDTMRQISDVSRQMTDNSHDLLNSIFELNETAEKLRQVETQALGHLATAADKLPPSQHGNDLFSNERSALLVASGTSH